MAISDRITSIEEHIKESYQELEGIGIDTTGVNNNLENIPKLIDGYWETLPKVTGEGTSITLDNTKEGKMKIDLKGNTSQATTTGKNLLKNTDVNSGDNNYWSNYSTYDKETGTLTRSTTLTTESYIPHRINLKNNTKYTISCLAKSNGYVRNFDIYAYNSTTTKVYSRADISLTTSFQKYSFTFTTDSATDFTNSAIRFDNNGSTQSGTEATLTIKDVMLVEGEDTEFEPYTNGPSPNPDYPQDIHVVSGDNEINVCSKNLFEPTTKVDGTDIIMANGSVVLNDDEYTLTATGTDCYFGQVLSSGGSYIDNRGELINVEGMSEITFTITNTLFKNNFITAYDSSKVSLGFTQFNSNTGTYTLPSSTKYITIRFGLIAVAGNSYSTKVQIEKGSTPSEYEKHIGNTYSLSLGYANYRDTAKVISNYALTAPSTTYPTGWVNETSDYTLYIPCKSNTEYKITKVSSDRFRIATTIDEPSTLPMVYQFTNDDSSTQHNITTNSTAKYLCVFFRRYSDTLTMQQIFDSIKIEEVGSSYIELCKIGNYQDIIKKSTGKNLAREEFESKYYLTGSGDNRTVAVAIYKISEIIEVQPNTTYTISGTFTDFADNVIRIAMFDNLPTTGSISTKYISSASSPYTFTTDTNTKYILIWNSGGAGDTIIHKLQLELGSSQTTYEPYGTGWYVKKEIGKVVLNGSEPNWNVIASSNLYRAEKIFNILPYADTSRHIGRFICSHFYPNTNNEIGVIFQYKSTLLFYVSSGITTVEQWKTWLGNNNTTLCYVLATPTYTEITDSTLLSQLNALAKSYTSQTNISQESNDLASLLNATALEEM